MNISNGNVIHTQGLTKAYQGVKALDSLNLPIDLIIVTILVLGEEIGFRGYMLPRLLGLGPKRAVMLSGFSHATWHLPIALLTPFYEVLIIPIFLLVLTAAGVIIGLLRLETDSIWPGTILHGAFNAFWDVFAALTVLSSPLAVYLVGESGLLTLLATASVAFWFSRRWKTPVEQVMATV